MLQIQSFLFLTTLEMVREEGKSDHRVRGEIFKKWHEIQNSTTNF
jgi:hypothetical protein